MEAMIMMTMMRTLMMAMFASLILPMTHGLYIPMDDINSNRHQNNGNNSNNIGSISKSMSKDFSISNLAAWR